MTLSIHQRVFDTVVQLDSKKKKKRNKPQSVWNQGKVTLSHLRLQVPSYHYLHKCTLPWP